MNRHPLRLLALVVAVGVAAIGVILAINVSRDPQADDSRSPLLGRPAPAFQVETLDGATLTSDELAGKTVVVNFWNSWCIPCREEHPALVAWNEENAGNDDVVMVGISRDDTEDAIRDYARREGVTWPVGIGPGAKQATVDFGTRGQPETFVIGPDGIVAGSYYGPVTVDVLDQMVARAQGTA